MRIVFATNNAHKLEEARRIAGGEMEILSLADIGFAEELPETCDTIEGNSLQKARRVWERCGMPCFSDDTGLFVDALGGAPGVRSARYAGPQCDPSANVDRLLGELEGTADRRARFRTVVTLCGLGDGPLQWEGRVEGRIAYRRHGNGGFGYDPVFILDDPDGGDNNGISFAEMSPEAKNAVSHRGRALARMTEHLKQLSSKA